MPPPLHSLRLLREVHGNPCRFVPFEDEWRTDTAITLARQMYDSRQHTLAEIARTLGVSRASIYRHLGQQADLGAGTPLPRG